MRDRLADFPDAEVVIITFAQADLAAYHAEWLAPLRVLIDENRVSYRAYQLGRGRPCQVWGPKIWWAYAKLIARGRRVLRPTGDTLQLGGDFVVGRDGRVSYAFRSADPGDRRSVDELVAAARVALTDPGARGPELSPPPATPGRRGRKMGAPEAGRCQR